MTDTPAQRAFAAEAGLDELVYPVDDAPALAGLIDRILVNRKRFAALRREIWQLGQSRYNWDIEKSNVVDRVATALAATRSGQEALEVTPLGARVA